VICLREHLKKLTEWESELEDVETDSNNKMQMIEMVEDDQEREYLKNVMEKEKRGKVKSLIHKIENIENINDNLLTGSVIN